MSYKVFVYGTLRKGFWNHVLLKDSEFVEERWLPGFRIHGAGIPFMVRTENENDKVYGEIYKVDDETLQQLDWLEGHPDWYVRQEVDEEGVQAYVMPETHAYATELQWIDNGVYGGRTYAES